MSHFTDAALATRRGEGGGGWREEGIGERKKKKKESPNEGAGESERQINASPALQRIRTRITAVTAAPARSPD